MKVYVVYDLGYESVEFIGARSTQSAADALAALTPGSEVEEVEVDGAAPEVLVYVRVNPEGDCIHTSRCNRLGWMPQEPWGLAHGSLYSGPHFAEGIARTEDDALVAARAKLAEVWKRHEEHYGRRLVEKPQ